MLSGSDMYYELNKGQETIQTLVKEVESKDVDEKTLLKILIGLKAVELKWKDLEIKLLHSVRANQVKIAQAQGIQLRDERRDSKEQSEKKT